MLTISPSARVAQVLAEAGDDERHAIGPVLYRQTVRSVVAMGLPSIASFLLLTLYDLIDIFWLAKLGEAPVAAVTIFGAFLWVVTFQNQIDPDLVRLVGVGSVDLALADGTSLVPAVSQGIPVRYVATIYARFPNVVFADAAAGITTAADLEDRRIGIPGRFGSGWIMLQAILGSAGLTPEDATIIEYPDFGQLVGVQQGAVDAATGFVNNEPVRLELEGGDPVLIRVDDIVPLPGNGLIVGESTAAGKPGAVRAFIAATLRAMEDIIADPEAGLEAALVAVPELAPERDAQLAVLEATIETWESPLTDREGLGAIDPADWAATIDYLGTLDGDLVPNPVTVDQLISTEFLPQ